MSGGGGDYLPLSGGTLSGPLTFSINDATAQIQFTRAGFNYIAATATGGILAFVPNGAAMTAANSALTIYPNKYIGIGNTSTTTQTNYRLYVVGTIGCTGAVTQNTSDLRLKTDLGTIDCLEVLLKLGNVFTYRYNGLAVGNRNWLDSTTLHTGIAYQNAIKANIPDFTGMDEYGYGYVNYLSSDYQATLLGGVLALALKQRAMENDVNALRQRIAKLEERIKELEMCN